ncbi:MAG: bifunctional (p)ppGpp synthetase/guanosine-3',5'-bis(diphosphate) 3'-pyrophosphohydrolase [Actinomycetota bacterium]|nr:bifunctional (p)ppGpp synthetase/guanosine-3',5'-bis(diphosphate) 3'-pyrophosphohydrolase [Actinomycetota bacterium]
MATTEGKKKSGGRGNGAAAVDFAHRRVDHAEGGSAPPAIELDQFERNLLGDLFAVIEEHDDSGSPRIERDPIERAFVFACERHADQRRRSGEDFIVHPVAVAKICAGMRLDTATLCAALLHDTVEDTSASLMEVRDEFGEEIATLVDGVTKLTGITFQSRDEKQAENYRKMIVAMAHDIRVVLIKLADRLHNMRTLDAMPKQKQQETAKETLEIFAPLAHRLGIHAIKWELEDLAFATLHPRKYKEIKGLVNQQREERERYVARAGEYLRKELEEVGIEAEISGRAKHFYSIYSKMTKKGREFNEIYDLTAMRVLVGSVKDCYGAIGVIHSLWKPLPGRFKDWVAMPKFNRYQALHTTVIGPEGRPLEIQIRTRDMHETAEYGIAAHWTYKDGNRPGPAGDAKDRIQWIQQLLDWQKDLKDPQDFVEGLKVDLFEDEVFVFTPKGEVKSLAAGATPLDFAYEIHTDVGHRCVGAKVNGKIVPLHYELRSGDICEVLTSKKDRGPSRDWLSLAKTTRAQSKIRAWFKRERREDAERTGREILAENLKRAGLPAQKMSGSPLLADVIREMGFKKGEDFYIALGQAKVSAKVVTNKLLQRLKQGEAAVEAAPGEELLTHRRKEVAKPTADSSTYGIDVKGIENVPVRLAKCCRPVPGDGILGYISLGKGITIHRADCSNAKALKRNPERFTPVEWAGEGTTSFRVELQVDGWDRTRMLEDLSRTFAESGINILEARCTVDHPMVKNRFVVEVGDTQALKHCIQRLRNVDSVFDAYRVTPTA